MCGSIDRCGIDVDIEPHINISTQYLSNKQTKYRSIAILTYQSEVAGSFLESEAVANFTEVSSFVIAVRFPKEKLLSR